MKNEQKSVTYVNYTYKFTEMIEELKKSIETATAVLNQQHELADIIMTSEKKEKFAEFVDSLNTQSANIEAQIKKLVFHKECLEQVEKMCYASNDARYAVSMLLEGLGLENQECKSIEERKNELAQ